MRLSLLLAAGTLQAIAACGVGSVEQASSPGTAPSAVDATPLTTTCHIKPSYPGELFAGRYFVGNPESEQDRYLFYAANLEPPPSPDRLTMRSFFDAGERDALNGAFALPSTEWEVALCADYQEEAPSCVTLVPVVSGSLEVTGTRERLSGTLRDAVFVQENTASVEPCETSIALLSFDQPVDMR